MSASHRKQALALLVCLLALWPAVHLWLSARYEIDPWELFGWGICCCCCSEGYRHRRGSTLEDDEENETLDRWVKVAVTPILFSVDNFLAGGAITKIVRVVAEQNNMSSVAVFAICSFCCMVSLTMCAS